MAGTTATASSTRDEMDGLIVGHNSTNFDRAGSIADRNVVFPIDRLAEMEADGVIGRVAPRHLSFLGSTFDLSTFQLDTGPAAARLLRDDGVDVVLAHPGLTVVHACRVHAHPRVQPGRSRRGRHRLDRQQAQAIAPPRALHCDFPLGRPLGKPRDPAYQRRVLDAAFALLDRIDGPVLADFPDTISDDADMPLACPLPPRHDPHAHPAVDEARGLRAAWQRTRLANGATQVGRVIQPDDVPDAIVLFVDVADHGAHWKAVAWPGKDLLTTLMDIRLYYEEAAIALVDHVPAAHQTDAWFYESTQIGALLRRFRAAVETQDPPFKGSTYLFPTYQQDRST